MRYLLVALALLVAGCSDSGTPRSDGGVTVSNAGGGAVLYYVRVPDNDGRTVHCVAMVGSYKAGLSCDWDRRSSL